MSFIKTATIVGNLLKTFVFMVLFLPTYCCFAATSINPATLKAIRVVMDDNYPPYVFKGDQGELKGIIVDQWRLWEKKTGTTVELTGMDWAEAQRRMQAGEFDVIDTIFRNEKREAIYDFTKPYAQLDVPLFFHEDISGIRGPEDLKGFLVAVKAGDNSIDVLKKHGVTNIAEYPSYEKLIEAARDGKAKVFTVDRPPALYYLNKMGIQNHFHETKPLYHGEFHRAVPKGQTVLLSYVEDGFAAISKQDYKAVNLRWMGSDITSIHYFRYALYGACVIAFLLLLLIFWLRTLRRAVAEKTAELAKSEDLFKLFMKHSPVYVFIKEVTPTGSRVLQASKNFEEMVGVAGSKMIGKMMSELFPAEFAAKIDADDRNVVAMGEVLKIDEELNGRSYTTIKFPLVQDDKTLLAGYTIDITERKQMEEALRESKARFKAFYDLGLVGLTITSPEKGWLNINECLCNMLGYTEAELHKMTWEQLTHPDDIAADVVQFERMLSGEIDGYELEKRFLTSSGGSFFAKLVVRCVRKPDQSVDFVVAMVQDISERKQFEYELRDADWKFRALFNNGPIGVAYHSMIYDDTGKAVDYFFIDANDNYIALTGVDPRGKTVTKAFPGIENDSFDWIGTFGKVARTGETIRFEQYLQANDRWYDVVGYQYKPDHFVASFVEITDSKHAEEQRLNLEKQLLHAQKLESLGVLAGGIAHDFNNLLMAIMGNADLALMRLNPESPAVDNLKRIEQASARAADLAKQMLAYSGKGKFVVEALDISRLVEEMLHMLEVSISKKSILRFNLTSPIPLVEADATQLRQIIMNLVINASEAIGDKSGVIAITTGCMDCDRGYLRDVWLDENLTDGLYVYLEIADTGCGMDKETLSKLFDPFFTTKFTGRGLGMAAVLGIVRGHKGAIKVYSEQEKGTTFKVLLPASGRPAELFNGAAHADDWQGSGTVLLVDDEETVRGIGTEMLKELGFTVITADDGIEAVTAFKQHPDIVLVILDLTMPHMDGEQCFRELRHLNPDVKVIMSSGFSEFEVTQKFAGKGLAGFIQKPYNLSGLKNAVRGTAVE
jgi:PAS domain S-box-containing protein